MRIQTFPDIEFKNHHLVDFVWRVKSSSSGEVYKIKMTEYGFSCNCTAGAMRGKCKHAKFVHDQLVAD